MESAIKLDPQQEILDTIEIAVFDTFKQILGSTPHISRGQGTFIYDAGDTLIGIIPLNHPETQNYLLLSFEKNNILKIAGAIFGQQFTTIDKAVESCVCELCNMTYGIFKTKMNQAGYQYKMSLPYILNESNKNLQIDNIETLQSLDVQMNEFHFKAILIFARPF